MPRIIFRPYNIEIEAEAGETILDAARRAGIYIRSVCGGKGSCKKCLVKILSGNYKAEEQIGDYVLACRATCVDICEVFIPPETRLGVQKLLSRAKIKLEVEVSPRVDARVLQDGSLEVYYRDKPEITLLRTSGSTFKVLGLAVDVGTTKVVMYLVDLLTGEIVFESSFTNPQIRFGDDVISRIEYCRKHRDGVKVLQRLLIDKLNEEISRALSSLGLSRENIVDAVFVGNTVMTYILLGDSDVVNLVESWYRVDKRLYETQAVDLGLHINERASITALPCVSRFFGGDLIADIIATKMHEKEELQLLVDIGTNTQVVLGCSEWMIATSGPGATAFEGWGVTCGVRATEGAIEKVRIQDDKVEYTTIGNVKPIGLCGSALIDIIAELYRNGIIDEQGKFVKKSGRVRERPDGTREFVVVDKSESGTGADIVITERDIANIIDSKATVCALVSTLLRKMRLSTRDISRVYICGAFANNIDLTNAVYIGLLPEFPNAEIVFIGNGAIAGAYMTLVNFELRKLSEDIASKITYIDMVNDSDFLEEYQANLSIPGKRELFPSIYSS